jgi:hypothetical protein
VRKAAEEEVEEDNGEKEERNGRRCGVNVQQARERLMLLRVFSTEQLRDEREIVRREGKWRLASIPHLTTPRQASRTL